MLGPPQPQGFVPRTDFAWRSRFCHLFGPQSNAARVRTTPRRKPAPQGHRHRATSRQPEPQRRLRSPGCCLDTSHHKGLCLGPISCGDHVCAVYFVARATQQAPERPPSDQVRITTALGHLRASRQPDRRRLCVAPRFDKPDPRGFLPRRFRAGSTILPSIPSPKHPQQSPEPPRQTPGCTTLEQNTRRRRRPRPTPSCALCATAITLSVAARVRLLSSNPPVARTNQIAHRHTQCGQDNMHM